MESLSNAKAGLILRKALLLVSLGMPGLMKLIIVFLINYMGDIRAVGEFSNDLNIAMILSSTSSVGFAVVVLNRIPKLNDTLRTTVFLRLTVNSLLLLIPFILILPIIKPFDLYFNWVAIVLFMFGTTVYQLVRQYFYALKNYWKCMVYDVVSMFAVVLPILTVRTLNPLIIMGVSLFVVGLFYISLSIRKFFYTFNIDEVISGLRFGLSNLSSTILVLISVPLAQKLLGIEYAGLLGLINPILALILLLPRGLSVYYVPEMVKICDYSNKQKELFNSYKKVNFSILIFISIAFYFCWHTYMYLYPDSEIILNYSNLIISLIILNIFLSQFALPFFSLLNAWDDSKFSLKINFLSLLFFLVITSFLVLFHVSGIKGFVFFYVSLFIVYIVRTIYLHRYINLKFHY